MHTGILISHVQMASVRAHLEQRETVREARARARALRAE